MAKVSFLLTQPNATKATPVFAFVAFNGQRVKVATHLSVLPERWDKSRQRLDEATAKDSCYLNQALDLLQEKLLTCYAQHRAKGLLPTATTLRQLSVPALVSE